MLSRLFGAFSAYYGGCSEILTQVAKQLLGHPPVPTLPGRTNAKIQMKKGRK